MFTGLVRAVGEVVRFERGHGGAELRIRAPDFSGRLAPGDSIAIDGVCQTVVEQNEEGFDVQAVLSTLNRTTMSSFEPGRSVNLEPALRAGDELGGHIVQGHVDDVGVVGSVERDGETVWLRIELPDEIAAVTVPRGSLTVDGVSLTVSQLEGSVAEFAIIPYTWSHTALPRLTAGDRVNLEADIIGKYIRRILESRAQFMARVAAEINGQTSHE